MLKLFKDSSVLTIFNFASAVLSILSISVVLSAVSLSDYGVFVLIFSFCLIFRQVLSSRSWEFIQVYDDVNSAIWIDFFYFLIFVVLFFPVRSVFSFYFPVETQQSGFFFLCYICAYLCQTNSGLGAARKDGRVIAIGLFVFFPTFIRLVLVIFYREDLNIFNLFFIQVLADSSKIFISYICLHRYLMSLKIFSSFSQIFSVLQKCLLLNFTQILDIPSKEFDKVLVAYFAGPEFTAVLALIKRISSFVALIYSPLYQLFFGALRGLESLRERFCFTKKVVFYLMLLSVFPVTVLYLSFDFYNSIVFHSKLDGYRLILIGYCAVIAFSGSLSPFHALFTSVRLYGYTPLIVFVSNIFYLAILTYFLRYSLLDFLFIPIFFQIFSVFFLKYMVFERYYRHGR